MKEENNVTTHKLIEEYSNKDTKQLELLKSYYENEIKVNKENSLGRKLCNKLNWNFSLFKKNSLNAIKIIFGIFSICLIVLFILLFITKDSINQATFGFSSVIITVVMMIPMGILFSLLDEGNRENYDHLDTIDFVLNTKRKESKKIDDKDALIINILKATSQGYSLTDLEKEIYQKKVKGLDRKEILKRLDQLEPIIETKEGAYNYKSGKSYKNTKIYKLK
jgi:uncharacterized membrane protein